MTNRVAIPEKTLEHWGGGYLRQRFPSSNLWWPTQGEDTAVELFNMLRRRPRPSLAVALEFKTATPRGMGHIVKIRLRQLDGYLKGTQASQRHDLPLPAYYVFPIPHWSGEARPGVTTVSTCSDCPEQPEAWWSRDAGCKWFGDWTVVMSAWAVSDAIDYHLAKKSPPTDWRTILHDAGKNEEPSETLYISASMVPPSGVPGLPAWPLWRHWHGRPFELSRFGVGVDASDDEAWLWPFFWEALAAHRPGDGIFWSKTGAGNAGYIQALVGRETMGEPVPISEPLRRSDAGNLDDLGDPDAIEREEGPASHLALIVIDADGDQI